MTKKTFRSRLLSKTTQNCVAVVLFSLLAPGDGMLMAQSQAPAAESTQEAATIPPDLLDSLVAPIALSPDPMVAQVGSPLPPTHRNSFNYSNGWRKIRL
jgi:hypothetical protein